MLSNLLQIYQWIFQSPAYSSHTPKGGSLELFALEEGLCVFEEADIVSGDRFDQMFGGGELAEGNAEMICVVEGVQEILVYRI